jgi:hypothetical protein
MLRRRLRGVVIGLSFAGGVAAAAPAAWAQGDQSAPPEAPPPAFVAPPPGYEPPTQYAQAGAPAAAAVAEAAPTFMTLDRMDGTARLGIQVGWDKIDDTNLSDGFLMRYEPYGQYVFPNRVVGIYGHIPISHAFNFNSADATGIGNIDLGGFFMPMQNNQLILRAGLALSTASDNGNDEFANIATTYERLTDLLQVAPNYTTLRLSASTVQQWDSVFFRADVGFDLAVDKPGTATTSIYFRGNAALGVRATGVDVMLELVNLAAANGNVNGGIEGRFIHTAGVGVRTQGEHQFHAGAVFPLDDNVRGEIWIISLGYQLAMNI